MKLTPFSISALSALALTSFLPAEDFPVQVAPFTVKSEIKGTLIPTETQTFTLSPERWKKFVIESVPAHGAELKAGDALITFDTEEIDRTLLSLADDVASKKLQLEIKQRELAELQQKNTFTLNESKRKLEEAEADLAYYKEIGFPAAKESAEYTIVRAKNNLAYTNEELKQLLKMYEEDDLTEETEEIILFRQKASVRDAETYLANTEREAEKTISTELPRRLLDLEGKVEIASTAYATAKLNLSRQYDLKKIEVDQFSRSLETAEKSLAETQDDRKLFDITAEFDGRLYYGEFADGVWKKGKSEEYLRKKGALPTEKIVLTLVQNDSPLSLQALMSSEEASELAESLGEAPDAASKLEISPYPNLAGKHIVSLPAAPAEAYQFPGQPEKTEVVFYENEEAISIPLNTVKTREDGTQYVLVKLSEGNPEERAIELGRENEGKIEVLSGLEVGQVILP